MVSGWAVSGWASRKAAASPTWPSKPRLTYSNAKVCGNYTSSRQQITPLLHNKRNVLTATVVLITLNEG